MQISTALSVLEDNKASYDRMAKEFSATRGSFWEELTFLKEHATPKMRVLDIGCGNGRFYPVVNERQVAYTGVDNSKGLLDEARKKWSGVAFVEGDATALPFEDGAFDIAYSFATLHHIPSKKLQAQFFTEAARVLRPNGTFIITTWYLWRSKYLARLFTHALQSILFMSPLDIGDMMHTFGKDKHSRYLHAFTERGLLGLMKKNGFEIVGSEIVGRASGSGEQNILVVAKKR